jgi:hypothetical protein
MCRASLLARGSESSKQNDAAQAEESFRKLLTWSSEYWLRTDLRSHVGHQQMYEQFPGEKRRFTVRREVEAFIQSSGSRPNQTLEMAR